MRRLEDLKAVIGRSPETLTTRERSALAGQYIAMEVYTPAAPPRRHIEAIGGSVAECVRQLQERGLDPARFEFTRIEPAF